MNIINNYNLNYKSHTSFSSGNRNIKHLKKSIPSGLIKKLGLDLTTHDSFKVKGRYEPAPKTIEPSLREYFERLKINWATHVDPSKNSGLYM